MCFSSSHVWSGGKIKIVRDITVFPYRNTVETRYDLFVGAIGYESRASHAVLQVIDAVDNVVSAPFERNQLLNYEANLELFHRLGTVLSGDERYRKELREYIDVYLESTERRRKILGKPFRVCVDISSMTRLRLADTMVAIYFDRSEHKSSIAVDWIYSPSRYSTRLLNTGPVQFNDAIPNFEGWGDPVMPLHAVVGLGLEGDLALGVLDDLEPADTTVFEPVGFDEAYDRKINERNRNFISGVPLHRRFRYDVTSPYASFLTLSSAVSALSSVDRVVILPLGPKIFALMSLLIASVEQETVTIWRLSADVLGEPIDRKAAGPIYGLTAMSEATTCDRD